MQHYAAQQRSKLLYSGLITLPALRCRPKACKVFFPIAQQQGLQLHLDCMIQARTQCNVMQLSQADMTHQQRAVLQSRITQLGSV